MRKVDVLIEFESDNSVHFEQSSAALSCYEERSKVADKLLKSMSGLGVDYDIEVAPTALFDDGDYAGFEIPEVSQTAPQGGSWILPAKIDATKDRRLQANFRCPPGLALLEDDLFWSD